MILEKAQKSVIRRTTLGLSRLGEIGAVISFKDILVLERAEFRKQKHYHNKILKNTGEEENMNYFQQYFHPSRDQKARHILCSSSHTCRVGKATLLIQ